MSGRRRRFDWGTFGAALLLLVYCPVALVRYAYWTSSSRDALDHDWEIEKAYKSYDGSERGGLLEMIDAMLFRVFPHLERQYSGGPPVLRQPLGDAPSHGGKAIPIVWICPSCRFDNRSEATFCGNCLTRRPLR